jgi:hypothetical protein
MNNYISIVLMIYVIIGAGGFGLYTALNLRKLDKDAIIKIIDKDKSNSSTVNGGNGVISITPKPNNFFNFISIGLCNKYKTPLNINKINNIEWYLIHIINNIFNNNKKKIVELTGEDDEYHEYNYWDKIYKLCEENNIEIIQDNIKDYDNKIVYGYNNYNYDKLILATGSDLSLIKNKCYSSYINIFSGVAVIVKVKNVPNKFYFANDIFITPYKDDTVKITCLLQLGTNLNINKEKIYQYIKNNNEVKKLGFIDIINYWEGSRPMSYDTIPFYTKLTSDNVYWISGGSFLGSHTCELFGEKLAEYIISGKTNEYFTLKRLIKIKKTYTVYFIIIIIIILILMLILRV